MGEIDMELIEQSALVFVMELHRKGELSEGQCCKALGLDRVTFRGLVDAYKGHWFPLLREELE